MRFLNNLKEVVILLTLIAFMLGCGSSKDDETSNTNNNLTMEQESSQEVALVTLETAKSYLASLNTPVPSINSKTQASQLLSSTLKHDISLSTLLDNLGKTEIETETEEGDCGGSLTNTTTVTTPDDTSEIFPITIAIDASFIDYCIGEEDAKVTIDGTLNVELGYTSANNGYQNIDYDISYNSNIPFAVYDGSIIYSESCTITDGVSNCSVSVNHETNGVNYTLEEIVTSGDNNSGYNLEATLINDQDEEYTISVNNLTLCENGNIQSGTIEITDSSNNSVISMTISDCDSAVITYQGETWTVDQN